MFSCSLQLFKSRLITDYENYKTPDGDAFMQKKPWAIYQPSVVWLLMWQIGWARVCRGTQLGQLIPTEQRDSLQCVMSGSGIEEKRVLMVMTFAFPSKCYRCWSSVLQYGTGHLPKVRSELIPLFPWLAHTCFAFPIKISLSSSMSLLASILFSSWPSGKGIEQGAGWVFDW